MARRPRIHFFGALYHSILRGNKGEKIFFIDEDRNYFYSLLEKVTQSYDCHIHAVCLMSNHVHFAIQVFNTPLSKIMQNISYRYARYINKKRNVVGHLFQGRYKAILVNSDSYIASLIRYIHLNPVRANIVSEPIQYLWSTHRAYNGFEHRIWLTTNYILKLFSAKREVAIHLYNDFIAQSQSKLENDFINGNQKGFDILSDDEFLLEIPIKKPTYERHLTLPELILLICKIYSVNSTDLIGTQKKHIYSKIRVVVTLIAKEFKLATVTEVAKYFNRDITALTHAINGWQGKSEVQRELEIIRLNIKASTTHA